MLVFRSVWAMIYPVSWVCHAYRADIFWSPVPLSRTTPHYLLVSRGAQFYSWYFHTLPFLLWQTNYPIAVRLAVLVGVEFGFNVFPATPVSSAVLQVGPL